MKLDLANPDACRSAVFIYQPDWVLNAGAYTAVDRAETDRELAHKVNAEAPRAFAESLASINRGSRLLQISTDFVFSGGQSYPYRPEDPVNPSNSYGASKAEGERAVSDARLRPQWARCDPAHRLGVRTGGQKFPTDDAAATQPESH